MKKFNGSYTKIRINNGNIIKRIDILKLDKIQQEILQTLNYQGGNLLKYYEILNSYNLPVEKPFNIVEDNGVCEYTQKFYKNALNVDEILEREFENIDHPNYEKIFKILNDIMKMWAISHSQNRAYIDFNLKNLIYYEHDKIVFVDLFPPILNNINQTNSYKIKNQIDLWTDKYINLGSMLAYFVQPLVIKHKTSKNLYKILKYIFDNAFNIIENQTHLSKDDILLRLNKSSHVFAKRFVDIYKFATQSTDNQQFLDTYLNAKLF